MYKAVCFLLLPPDSSSLNSRPLSFVLVLAVACLGLRPGEFKVTVSQQQEDQKPLTLMETIFSGNSAEYFGLQVSRLHARGVSTTFKVIPSTQDLSYEVVLDRRVDSATNEISYPATYKYTFN